MDTNTKTTEKHKNILMYKEFFDLYSEFKSFSSSLLSNSEYTLDTNRKNTLEGIVLFLNDLGFITQKGFYNFVKQNVEQDDVYNNEIKYILDLDLNVFKDDFNIHVDIYNINEKDVEVATLLHKIMESLFNLKRLNHQYAIGKKLPYSFLFKSTYDAKYGVAMSYFVSAFVKKSKIRGHVYIYGINHTGFLKMMFYNSIYEKKFKSYFNY